MFIPFFVVQFQRFEKKIRFYISLRCSDEYNLINMNHFSLMLACTLASSTLFAQNLVPNPDLELRDSDFCGIAGPNDLSATLANWYSPSGGTPDVHFTDISNACWNFQPNSSYPGPIGLKGHQLPRSGSSMAGFFAYTIDGLNQREYLQVQLMSPLVPTGKYLVEFYVSLADSTEFSSNNLGFNLSVTAPSGGGDGVLNVTPQFAVSNEIDDTQGWVRVFDTITVTEAFEYLTIGNFFDDNSTSVVSNPTASFAAGTYGAYYFIDDVRVTRVFTGPAAINEQTYMDVRIFPNPTTDEAVIEFNEIYSQTSVDLLDASGKVLWTTDDVAKQVIVDLRKREKGMYFIRINSDSGSRLETIVKQ